MIGQDTAVFLSVDSCDWDLLKHLRYHRGAGIMSCLLQRTTAETQQLQEGKSPRWRERRSQISSSPTASNLHTLIYTQQHTVYTWPIVNLTLWALRGCVPNKPPPTQKRGIKANTRLCLLCTAVAFWSVSLLWTYKASVNKISPALTSDL